MYNTRERTRFVVKTRKKMYGQKEGKLGDTLIFNRYSISKYASK